MIFLMAAPAPTDWAKILTWENLFPGVDEMIKIAQIPFLGIAFVMLVAHVYGSIGKTAATRGLDLAEWIRPFLMASVAAVCIANISTFTSMGINAGNDIAREVSKATGGSGATDVAATMWKMGEQFIPSASTKQQLMDKVNVKDYRNKSAFAQAKVNQYASLYGTPNEATVLRITSKAHRRWDVEKSAKPWDDWSEDLSDAVTEVLNEIMDGIFYVVKALMCFFIFVLLLGAALVIMVVKVMQLGIVKLGGIMLPVFIAGVVTNYFRTQAINYIFSMVGVMLWPVGWAICLVGTVALGQAMQSVLVNGLGLVAGAGDNGIKNALWGNVAGDAFGGIVSLWNIFPLLFWLVVIAFLLVCWVLVTMWGFPVLIQRAVTSGANVAQSAIAGAGKMALNTAGAAMVTVGMGASAAAAMKAAGGSPSSGDTSSPPGPTDGGDSKALAKLGGFGDSVGDSSRGGGGGGGAGKGASGVASRRATRTTTDANGKTVTETVEEVYQSDTAPKGKDGDASPSIGAGGGGGGGGGGFAGALAQAAKNMNPLTALGRTMQNLAASDGSPESMYRVPDTGIDETRRAIAESMQAMRNNRNPPKA